MSRVAFVSHSAELNGSELWLLETLRGIDRKRFEPILIVPEAGRLEDAARAADVETIRVPMVWWLADKNRRFRQPAAWALTRRSAGRMAHLLRERDPRLVFSNSAAVAAGAMAARRLGRPHVWVVHEMLAGPRTHLYHLRGRRAATAFILRSSRRVIANSRFCAGAFPPSDKIVIVPNGARLKVRDEAAAAAVRARLGAEPRSPVLGVIGKLYEGKGQREAVRAASLLQGEFPGLRLAVIGEPRDAGYAEAVRAEAARAGLAGRIAFEGWRPDLDDWLAAMDVLLVPSTVETFGRAALEGMACGTPVVAVAAGGSAEVMESGVNGILVAERTPALLAEAAARILRDPALAVRLAEGGRRTVASRFSLEAQVRAVESVLDDVLAEEGS